MAVHADAFDLVRPVGGADVSVRRVPAGAEVDDHNVALALRPLALDAEQPRTRVDHEVVAPALHNRPQNDETELDGRRRDRCLGYRSFDRALGQPMRTLVRISDG
jgi:hypothetical protein